MEEAFAKYLEDHKKDWSFNSPLFGQEEVLKEFFIMGAFVMRKNLHAKLGLERDKMREISLGLQLRRANSCSVEYGEKLRQAERQLDEACAEVERHKAGIEVIGELSTYPSRSKIVFEGNDQITELRGIDSQRVRVLIMGLEGENETVSL